MPPVKRIVDQFELVETKKFPHIIFPYEKFNPCQSRIFEIYQDPINLVIAASTSSGKTCIAEMLLAHNIKITGKKGIYLSPLKALSQEKINNWSNGVFKDFKISIATGDHRLTADRSEELKNADLIILTSEMLNSICRANKSEKNQFLKDVGILICDEAHGICDENRGSHLEVGLMKFAIINSTSRIVFLSATMPNVLELSEWLAYSLNNNKETYLLESTYRPCPLTIYYEKYFDCGTYENNEITKVQHALSLVQSYPEDKFLIFAHTKKTGQMMVSQLRSMKIDCDFHNADLEKEKRAVLENKFRTDPKFRVLVATSTMAAGLNVPARRAIILGPYRGMVEVSSLEIIQECGRSGRVGLDNRGDAYVLLPTSKYEYFKNKLQKPQKIVSQLLANVGGHYKILAFHLVSEIHHGNIKTRADIRSWYSRSLAHWQEKNLDDEILESTVDLLKNCGAIVEEDGEFKVTAIGRISSMFYYSPFDVSSLRNNFSKLFENHQENNDHYVSMSLGNTDTYRVGITSNAEKEAMSTYSHMFPNINEAAAKAGFSYYELLIGANNPIFSGIMRNMQWDFPRTLEVLNAIDSMNAKWGKKEFFRILNLRIRYGVRAELVGLCEIPNIGKVRSEKLYAAKIRTRADVAANPDKVQEILKMSPEKIKQICDDAAKV